MKRVCALISALAKSKPPRLNGISTKSAAFAATAVFAACMGLAPGARADVIYNYVFSPGAGYTNAGTDDTASLSGTFSWDANTNSIVASKIDLSGTDATGTSPGPVSCSNCTTGIYGAQYFEVNGGLRTLYIIFANALSLGADDLLTLHCCGSPGNSAEYQGGVPFTSVTGSANLVVPAVPEPASLALLGSGLLGFAMMRRRRHRV